jgi:hypothetical protein
MFKIFKITIFYKYYKDKMLENEKENGKNYFSCPKYPFSPGWEYDPKGQNSPFGGLPRKKTFSPMVVLPPVTKGPLLVSGGNSTWD